VTSTSGRSAMPRSAEPQWAADTSFAVAALDESHDAHPVCRDIARERRPALAGHAAFETFAVLTRLPGPLRVSPTVAGQLIVRAFPSPCWLSADQHAELLTRLAHLGVEGGQVYDALVAHAALVNRRTLLTRDTRARRIYDLIGVRYELVDG